MHLSRRNALLLSLLVLLAALPVVVCTRSAVALGVSAAGVGALLYLAAVASPAAPARTYPRRLRREHPPAVFEGADILPEDSYRPQQYAHNPYGNPSTFDYDRAVRGAAASPKTTAVPSDDADFAQRMLQPSTEIPEGLMMYPLPDQAYAMRQPMFADALISDRGHIACTDQMRITPSAPGLPFF